MEYLKILIIEDDFDIGLMMKMIFNLHGYDVNVFTNSYTIEEEINSQHYDLIFMDMLLSGRNGIDICTAIKKNPLIASIPLIMMSAHPDGRHICLKAGANDFIAKPFEVKELLLKVSEILINLKQQNFPPDIKNLF